MRWAAPLLALLAAGTAGAAPVPFVGCPADGQLGREAAPRTGRPPDVPGADAAALAFYATADGVGVLAPRGWHCFGSLGSNGMGVVVMPGPVGWATITGRARLRGPVVQLFQTSGGTSGRFAVAAVAARLFPSAAAYVARVEAESMFSRPLVHHPYPADRLRRRGPFQMLFTTPAGQEGLGTRAGLAPGPLPVDRVEWLHPDGDMDLTSLAVRLPPRQRPLAATILRQAAPPPKQ